VVVGEKVFGRSFEKSTPLLGPRTAHATHPQVVRGNTPARVALMSSCRGEWTSTIVFQELGHGIASPSEGGQLFRGATKTHREGDENGARGKPYQAAPIKIDLLGAILQREDYPFISKSSVVSGDVFEGRRISQSTLYIREVEFYKFHVPLFVAKEERSDSRTWHTDVTFTLTSIKVNRKRGSVARCAAPIRRLPTFHSL